MTKPGSRYPIAPYLERRTFRPSVFHHGNRGLDRSRILRDGELFLQTRTVLSQLDPRAPNPYRGITAQEIHRRLRSALLPRFPWLDQAAPPRIPLTQRLGDIARLLAFLIVVVFVLSLPGLLFVMFLRAFFPAWADQHWPLLTSTENRLPSSFSTERVVQSDQC